MRVLQGLFTFYLLFSLVSSIEITIIADNPTYAYESWVIQAYVTNNSAPINYPDCIIEIVEGVNVIESNYMDSDQDYADYSYYFDDNGIFNIWVGCYDETEQFDLSVNPNTQLDLSATSVANIGDTLQISASYEDLDNNQLSSASCTARLYESGALYKTESLYYNAAVDEFKASMTVSRSGPNRLTVSCVLSGHSTRSRSIEFDIEREPVIVTLSSSYETGNFGDAKTVTAYVTPYSAICSSSHGSLTKSTTSKYTLNVNLDFLGEKYVTLSC
ncbi:MAG: hypothetical protein GOU99_02515, partial [Candidatus Altiarchaeota archaeon]|nr:hypothetical protein [Candidatus Altiarchaeota archaeon]